MNAARRASLAEAVELLSQALDIVRTCLEDEEAALEALPEAIAQGSRGDAMQAAVEDMSNAETALDDAVIYLTEASR